MPSPTFLGDGHTARRSDPTWVVEQKILGALVDARGASSIPTFFGNGNTPRRGDALWAIEQRILGTLVDDSGVINNPPFIGDGNAPRRSDPFWAIEQKILGTLKGGTAVVTPPSDNPVSGLMAYWPMEETGVSQRDDKTGGGRHLVANTSIPNADGILGTACDLSGSSQFLQYNADAAFNFGNTSFEWWVWVRFDTLAARPIIYYGGAVNKAYILHTDGSNMSFAVSNDGTNFNSEVTSPTVLGTGTWYFVRCYHDAANNLIGISVNQETVETLAHSAGINTTGSMNLKIGRRDDVGGDLDARVDSLSVRTEVLSTVAAGIAYNGGEGFEHPWNTSGHNPPYSLIAKETFDAAGYDLAGWTEFLGSGIINEDYTGIVLDGTHSLRVVTAGGATWIERSITAANFVFCYFMLRVVAHDGTKSIIEAQSGVSARQGWVEILADLTFRVNAGASSLGSVGAIPSGTLVHCWFSYHNNLAGSRKTTFGFSTDGIRPTSGDNYREITAASSATQVAILALGVPGTDFGVDVEYIFDYFLYDNTQIKDKP